MNSERIGSALPQTCWVINDVWSGGEAPPDPGEWNHDCVDGKEHQGKIYVFVRNHPRGLSPHLREKVIDSF